MTWEQNRHFSKISDPRPSSISRSRPERGEFRMFEARYGESLSEANGGHKRFQSVNLRWFSSLQTYLWGGKNICFSEIDPRKKKRQHVWKIRKKSKIWKSRFLTTKNQNLDFWKFWKFWKFSSRFFGFRMVSWTAYRARSLSYILKNYLEPIL